MSRVSKNPITIPSGVEVNLTFTEIQVKGPFGILKLDLLKNITVEKTENNSLIINLASFSKQGNAMAGTTRALIANMVHGVAVGFQKKLILMK